MSLGIVGIREHVVEFIPGTGIRTDGVVNNASLNGPWSWTVPAGVVTIEVDACSGGGGGGGGYNTGTTLPGGGGAATLSISDFKMKAVPQSTLTVTVGAKGTGGNPGSSGTNGGSTKIAGALPGFYPSYITGAVVGDIQLTGGNAGNTADASGGGWGGTQGNGATGTPRGINGTTAAAAANFALYSGEFVNPGYYANIKVFGGRGGHGGGASTVGSTAGGPASTNGSGGDIFNMLYGPGGTNNETVGASGGTDGTNSRGAGAYGARSLFGRGGIGGSGSGSGNPGGAAVGYGAGGGGGSGGAAGGDGAPGYVRFTYWSMD